MGMKYKNIIMMPLSSTVLSAAIVNIIAKQNDDPIIIVTSEEMKSEFKEKFGVDSVTKDQLEKEKLTSFVNQYEMNVPNYFNYLATKDKQQSTGHSFEKFIGNGQMKKGKKGKKW